MYFYQEKMVTPSSCCPKTLCPPVWVTSPHLKLPPPPLIVQEHRDKSQEPTVSRCTELVCINRSRFALVKTMIRSSITMLPFSLRRKITMISIMHEKKTMYQFDGNESKWQEKEHFPMLLVAFLFLLWVLIDQWWCYLLL